MTLSKSKHGFDSRWGHMDYYLRIGTANDLKDPKERLLFRIFEIFPGFLSWLTLLAAIVFSWLRPVWVAGFIITFTVFWLIRSFYLSFHLQSGFKRMKRYQNTNWLERLKKENPKREELGIHSWKDVYHLILLPNYKEPYEIIKESIESFLNCAYPKERMMLVLSFEERAGKKRRVIAKKLEQEFGNSFFRFLITFHPDNLPGEIPGHGSNDKWAGKEAKRKIIDPLKIPYEHIIVSSFDVDTRVFPYYFACLTYHYLKTKKPTRTAFQPVPLYTNNIWQAPVFSQLFSFSSTFWQIMCQERPEKLITFSSHAISFRALVDVDFKQPNVVSDDSRIFWQCLFRYNGDFRVEPLFYPVSMDANVASGFWRTLINMYKQQKRWAYGVGDIPYFLFGFIKNKKIALSKKLSLGFELISGHWSWATASFLIFALGWLPITLGGSRFSQTVLAYNLPRLTSKILTFSMLGLITSIYLSLTLLPPRPQSLSRFRYLSFILGWLLFPVIMIVFSSFPALDAQTRWMLGRYMGFWATEKVRK